MHGELPRNVILKHKFRHQLQNSETSWQLSDAPVKILGLWTNERMMLRQTKPVSSLQRFNNMLNLLPDVDDTYAQNIAVNMIYVNWILFNCWWSIFFNKWPFNHNTRCYKKLRYKLPEPQSWKSHWHLSFQAWTDTVLSWNFFLLEY